MGRNTSRNTVRVTGRTRDFRIDDRALAQIDLSPLAQATKLREVYVRSDALTEIDLSPLAGKPIERLQLVVPAVRSLDLSPLAASPTITTMLLYPGAQHLDLSPLAGCRALAELYLSGIPARAIDLEPLGAVPMLQRLTMIDSGLHSIDLRPVAILPELRMLFVSGARVESVTLGTDPGFTAITHIEFLCASLRSLDVSALAPGTFLRRLTMPGHLEGKVDLSRLPEPSKRFEIEFRRP